MSIKTLFTCDNDDCEERSLTSCDNLPDSWIHVRLAQERPVSENEIEQSSFTAVFCSGKCFLDWSKNFVDVPGLIETSRARENK